MRRSPCERSWSSRRLPAFTGLLLALLALSAVGPAFAADTVDRVLKDPRIAESSGLAASTVHRGVLYTHNDSGDGPRVFAVRPDGSTQAVLTLRGAEARDWEGMSPGRTETDTIWVGDIGDNIDGWGSYRAYRFKEPATLTTSDVAWTRYDLRYADGKSHNAESLLIHPVTGRLYVVDKDVMGGSIYAAPTTLSTTQPNVLTKIGTALAYATDAAFSPDGTYYVVRGYVDAEVYATAKPGVKVAHIDLPAQPQGESIAWSPDGQFLYAGSEGDQSKVFRVSLPASITGASASTSSGTATPAPSKIAPSGGDVTPSDGGGLPRSQVLWLAAGAIVLIVLGISLRSWGKRDPDEA